MDKVRTTYDLMSQKYFTHATPTLFTARSLDGKPFSIASFKATANAILAEFYPNATATEFVLKLLKKRLFSSPQAFATTLDKHLQSLAQARRSAGVMTAGRTGVIVN